MGVIYMKLSLPGRNIEFDLKYMLLDLNGTIAEDGILIDGVKERIELLKKKFKIYLLTADTFGLGKQIAEELNIELFKVSATDGGRDKRDFLYTLGPDETIAIGNGYNDKLMLEAAKLSIGIVGREGACTQAIFYADIVINHINDALDLLLNPLRLVATLRA